MMLEKMTIPFLKGQLDERILELDELLQSPYPYEQSYVKVIKDYGQTQTLNNVLEVLENANRVLKIEGYEKFSLPFFDLCNELSRHFDHLGPVTCHLFKSPKDASSFPMHVDPDDVVIHMVKGRKAFSFVTQETYLVLEEGDSLFIPKGTPHQAINLEDNLMLSFGLELFTVEKYGL